MKITYRQGPIPSSKLQAGFHNKDVEWELLDSSEAAVYFYQAHETVPINNGIPVLIKEDLNPQTADVLAGWLKERRDLMKVSPLRHELGNLIVILLGRILRLKDENVGADHLASLQKLHERLSALYIKFDEINVPRD